MPKEQEVYGDDLQKYQERQPVVIPAEKSLLELVIEKGADLQTIETFMDLQDRHEKNEARKAFVVAMAEFKKNPPEIVKDMVVEFDLSTGGKTSYKHADLAKANIAISTELSKHGLSGRWDIDQENGIKVTYILTHIMGHSESVSMTAPPDTSGKKNPIQSIASTVAYLERYTMFAGTGLAAKGMDTDGKSPSGDNAEPESIHQDQIAEIKKLVKKAGFSDTELKERLAEHFEGTTEVSNLYANGADKLIRMLKLRIKENSK